MPLTRITVTGTHTSLGQTVNRKTFVYVDAVEVDVDGVASQIPVVMDLDGNKILQGVDKVQVDAEGDWSLSLPATDDANLDPSGYAYRIRVVENGREVYSDLFTLPAVTASPVSITDLVTAAGPLAASYVSLVAHLADTTDAHDASAISYAGSANLVATTVEAALDELDTEKQSAAGLDAAVAAFVGDTDTDTGAALSDTFVGRDARGQARAWASSRRGAVPNTVPLIVGSDEELAAFARVGFNAGVLDTTNTKINSRAWSFTAPGGTADPKVTFTVPSGPLTLANPAQAVCVWVYIPDVTGLTGFNINLWQTTSPSVFLSRGTAGGDFNAQTLVNGWNFLRFPLGPVWKDTWTGQQVEKIDLICKGSSAITPTMVIGHAYLECPAKARMIFVLDRGYRSFILNGGLARVRAAGIPITWAIDVTAMGGAVGTGGEAITLAEIRDMWEAGDSISFHGWDGTATSSMTDAQRRTDTVKSIRYLASQGYEGRMWRAAWVQNSGNAAAIREYVIGQAFSTPSAPVVWPQASHLEAWPPHNMHSIYRWNVSGADYAIGSGGQVGGGSAGYVDDVFAALQATHGLIVPYVHGIEGAPGSTGAAVGVPGNDITLEKWDYFMDKVEAGIAAGWLEPTTFEELFFESGGTFSQIGGGTLARWIDPDGTARTKTLL